MIGQRSRARCDNTIITPSDEPKKGRFRIMDLLNSPFMNGLAGRLRFLAARTGLIAENIANADTPDYAARDLKAPDFAAMARRAATGPTASAPAGSMRVADPRHMQATTSTAAVFKPQDAPDAEAGINGNKVSIETQMMKLSETRMSYQLASSVYRKGVTMMRLAARGGR